MRDLAQWVPWTAVPSKRPGKTDKIPLDWRTEHLANAQDPAIWTDYDTACVIGEQKAGFVFTHDDPYWFLDADSCISADGSWSPIAQDIDARLPGAAREVSHSGTGLHWFGRYSGPEPAHSCRNQKLGIELYTSGRFAAVTGREATGDADTDCSDALAAIVADWFPPATATDAQEWTDGPCSGWDGPADDEELIRRMLAAAARTPEGAFGEGTSFASLWAGEVQETQRSEADMSLAARLAFWTGRDCDRIERLMRSSDLAREKWDTHSSYLKNTILNACGWTSSVLNDRRTGTNSASIAQSKVRFLSVAECLNAELRSYVIKGLIAPGDVGCLFGTPGTGKSLIAPYLGFMVAHGNRAFGLRTKRGPVFYVAAEDATGMHGRLSALSNEHGRPDDFYLVEGVSNLFAEAGSDLEALLRRAAIERPSLIILDTLAMCFPGVEENTAEGMGKVVLVARRLTVEGAAVLIVHHDTKAEGRTPRGSSALNGALDVAIRLTGKDAGGITCAELTKNRNGSCDLKMAFQVVTKELGIDEDGDAITTAIADPAQATQRKPERVLTASEVGAMSVLDSLQAPGGVKTEAAWRTACMESYTVSKSERLDSRRVATKRAIDSLQEKRRVLIIDGTVNIVSAGPS